MADRIIIRRDYAGEAAHFVFQKQLIERHFPVFRCSVHNGVLNCVGSITPSDHCARYRISIRLKRGGVPEVRVREPVIPRDHYARAHVYRNGSLCLYDHRDRPWRSSDNLHETIIPWTAEWLLFYELYLICGKWLGPEAEHGDQEKAPEARLN